MTRRRHRTIGSLQRAIDILDLFDEQTVELGIKEMSEALGLHKSTAAGLAYSLEGNGYLDQDVASRKYRTGLKLVERAFTLLDQIDVQQIIAKSGFSAIIRRKEGIHYEGRFYRTWADGQPYGSQSSEARPRPGDL